MTSASLSRHIGYGLALSAGAAVVADVATGGELHRKLRYLARRPHQVLFVLTHPFQPWLAREATAARSHALAAQDELFPGQPISDNHVDAFRHAYASALMTLAMISGHGMEPARARELTEAAGRAHERDRADNHSKSVPMDLANNRAGALLVGSGRDANGEWLDRRAVRQLVTDALAGGQLVQPGAGGRLVPTDYRVEV